MEKSQWQTVLTTFLLQLLHHVRINCLCLKCRQTDKMYDFMSVTHHHHPSLFEQAWINPQQRVRPGCPVVVANVLSMLGGLRGQFVPCQVILGHASPTHPRSALACLGHSAPRSYALSLWLSSLCCALHGLVISFCSHQYQWISVTSYFQTSSKDILFSVSLPHFGCPPCLEYLRPRALILLRLWCYISHLLTY